MTRHEYFMLMSELNISNTDDLLDKIDDKNVIKTLKKEYDKRRTFSDMSFYLDLNIIEEKPQKKYNFMTFLEKSAKDD